ncbi:hypothetical protein GHT09_009192 [Marmota monax]|uniref:FERM N-terminal domain-containing protein n=1 Tax=Marmota monax TaxID=9995 RepID=A0A834QK36_MARMO|nr:hypothetical protein GHT09_009192 [Marmota monax]KAF7479613.1 hypothetical protein GHT09_009192 [Marmota monax]
MTSRLRALGGRINNIRTSELPKEKARSEVVCSIRFLDGLVQTFKVNKQDTGQSLLDMAYTHLGVTEKEYFGLQHGGDSVDSPRWLESSKPIRKQLKGWCDLFFSVQHLVCGDLFLPVSRMPVTPATQMPGDSGDRGELPAPHLTSELADVLADQPQGAQPAVGEEGTDQSRAPQTPDRPGQCAVPSLNLFPPPGMDALVLCLTPALRQGFQTPSPPTRSRDPSVFPSRCTAFFTAAHPRPRLMVLQEVASEWLRGIGQVNLCAQVYIHITPSPPAPDPRWEEQTEVVVALTLMLPSPGATSEFFPPVIVTLVFRSTQGSQATV